MRLPRRRHTTDRLRLDSDFFDFESVFIYSSLFCLSKKFSLLLSIDVVGGGAGGGGWRPRYTIQNTFNK